MTRLAWLLLVLALLAPIAQARADEPEEILAAAGLVDARKGWICAEEAALREQLDAVTRLERPYFIARERHAALLVKHDQLTAQVEKLRELRTQTQSRLKQATLNIGLTQQLEKEIRKMDESIAQAEKTLGGDYNVQEENSPLSKSAFELSNARNALALALLSVRRHHSAMTRRYAELAKDREVAAALAATGPDAALGPLENYTLTVPRKLDRLVLLVFSETLPVYRRSDQYRVALIVNDRTPFTFSFLEEDGPTIIPASLVQLAGLELDAAGGWQSLRFGDRVVTGRAVTIPRLRVGKFLLHNVPAWALPPEAEDLGARISRTTLDRLSPTIDRKRMELKLSGSVGGS